MDLRRLNHLVCLADTGSFVKAAMLCHITQSAFSRSIQAAEEEFGLQLFDRGPLAVKCTDAGAFVVERARKLLFDSRCLTRDVGLYRERVIGDLAFGVGPFASAAIAPALMADLRMSFPSVQVRVEINNADLLAARVREEALDFYLADVRNVAVAADLTVTKMPGLSAGFYVRAGHPLLFAPEVRLAMLLPYGLGSVKLPKQVAMGLAKLAGQEDGQSLKLAVECDDLNVLRHIAITTDTVIGYVDVGAAQSPEHDGLVKLTLADVPPLFADIAVVSLKGRSFSLMAEYAIERIAQIATDASQGRVPSATSASWASSPHAVG